MVYNDRHPKPPTPIKPKSPTPPPKEPTPPGKYANKWNSRLNLPNTIDYTVDRIHFVMLCQGSNRFFLSANLLKVYLEIKKMKCQLKPSTDIRRCVRFMLLCCVCVIEGSLYIMKNSIVRLNNNRMV